VVVRVNGAGTPWHDADVAAVAALVASSSSSGAFDSSTGTPPPPPPPLHAVLLPKVESASALLAARRALASGGAPAALPLWAMIETPRGVLRVGDIAEEGAECARDGGGGGGAGLAALVAGTADLTRELRAMHTPDRHPLLTALSLIVLAARSVGRGSGMAVLDGVHLDLGDARGLEAACAQGAAMGFHGKTLIHPAQIAAANAAFSPSPAALAEARRVLEAAGWGGDTTAAAAAGGGGYDGRLVVVDGRLVERMHVEAAAETVAVAARIAEVEAAAARGS
jgi:citrate lyase subunit beta/citryl-CoA lyase